MDPTCLWTLTPGSRRPSLAGLLKDLQKPIAITDGWLRHRSATEPVANTRAFPAPCPSVLKLCDCCWWNSAGRPRTGRGASCSLTDMVERGGAGCGGRVAEIRGTRRRMVLLRCAERRCPRRSHRNVCIATYFAGHRAFTGDGPG